MLLSPRSLLFSSHPKVSTDSLSASPPSPTSRPRQVEDTTTTIFTSSPKTTKATLVRPIATITQRTKYVGSTPDINVTVTAVRSVSSSSQSSADVHASMVKHKYRRETRDSLSPSSPPSTTTSLTRPVTPTSPVQIPTRNKNSSREAIHTNHKRQPTHHRRRAPRHAHSKDGISPSMAALLAITDIPRPRQAQAKRYRSDKPLTVDEIVCGQNASEKELSLTLSPSPSPSPMDMLLSPPNGLDVDDDDDDDLAASDSNFGSAMTRTTSIDSVPSLGDSFATDMVSDLETPAYQSKGFHRRRASPMRKSFEPVRSPPDTAEEHPLAAPDLSLDNTEFHAFPDPSEQEEEAVKSDLLEPFKPLRSVFKSNLTASLRALRSAAKSFSSINFSSIPPDDFLTRSLLTMDPKMPYTDERRPPVTEEMPSAELRRYLNPITTPRETQPLTPPMPGTLPASIQMQTYKIQRSRFATSTGRGLGSTTSSQSTSTTSSPVPRVPSPIAAACPPGMRQREMRENPDFIRIAVMEMAMRKRGKLDAQRPGRARWALPPRKTPVKAYEIGSNGVPERWTPVSYD